MRGDGKREEGQKGWEDDLRVCPQGRMEEEEDSKAHFSSPWPPAIPGAAPASPGLLGQGLPTPGGLREVGEIQNNADEAQERHRSGLGAAPLAGAVLWLSVRVPVTTSRDTRAVPEVTRAAFAAHNGIQSLPAGTKRCIPGSALGFDLGASLPSADVAPQVIPSPSPPSLDAAPCSGWAGMEQGWCPGEAWNSRACFAFCSRNVSSFGQMSKSELLHLEQLWKSLSPAPEPPVCVWRMLQNGADSAAALEFP